MKGWAKFVTACAFALLGAGGARGQGARFDDIALRAMGTGGVTYAPGATITVCTSAGTGTPCTPLVPTTPVTLCTSETCTTAGTNPFTADGLGNYGFWALPGKYIVTITGAGLTGYTKTVVLPITLSGNNAFTGNNTHSGTETFTGTTLICNLSSVRYVGCPNYPLTGTGLTTAISDCIADSLCSGVDARSLTAAVTVSSTLTVNKPMFLSLGPATVTLQGTPGLLVSSNINGVALRGIGQSGQASTSTTLNCIGASTDCVRWLGRRGSMSDLTILITAQNATNGLTLDAITAGQDVDFNTFTNISLVTSSTSTADGLRLRASDATHKVSFNQFINIEVIDFSNAGHMTGGVSVGPTNNFVFGGQFRQTVTRGNGWLLDNFSADNKWYGGNYSFYTTAIALTGGSGVTGNGFFGSVLESNTNACSIASGATDNHFYDVPFGSQPCTDSGTRTVVLNGNNQLGPGSSGLVKLGGPISFLSIGGGNSGIPAATGTNFSVAGNLGSPVLGRLYDGDGTGWQLDISKRTGSVDTTHWSFLDTGKFLGAAGFPLALTEGTAPAAAAAQDVCYGDSTSHTVKCSYNNGSFFNVPQTIASGTATMTTAAIASLACGTAVTVAATGVATTDTISFSFNTAPAANPAELPVSSWPTAGNVNFQYCNPTAASVTPNAATLNWRVVR